jgi:hypothetical protein
MFRACLLSARSLGSLVSPMTSALVIGARFAHSRTTVRNASVKRTGSSVLHARNGERRHRQLSSSIQKKPSGSRKSKIPVAAYRKKLASKEKAKAKTKIRKVGALSPPLGKRTPVKVSVAKKKMEEKDRELAEGDARYSMRQLMARHFRMTRGPKTNEEKAKAAAEKAQWNMRLSRLQHKELHAVALQAIPSPEVRWTRVVDPAVKRGIPAADDRIPSPKDEDEDLSNIGQRPMETLEQADIDPEDDCVDMPDELPER